ncbi:hypothetical protein RDABS01_008046, partial [Bienertia sinuspersici]
TYQFILQKANSRLNNWSSKLVSKAGKVVLIQSNLEALPSYAMTTTKLPQSISHSIDYINRNFFWQKTQDKHGLPSISWDWICMPKSQGGLGLRKTEAEGLIWRVGNGCNINVWQDPWVVDEVGRFITSEPVEGIQLVSDLINFEKMEWDVDRIEASFNQRDVNCILAIPLSVRAPHDDLSWAFSKDGKYSVRNAYMLGKGCNLENFHQAWVDIWSMEVIPKVRHFMWRVCTSSLPVKSLLKHRRLVMQAECPWCESAEETLGHALFECWRIRSLWEDSDCGCLLPSNETANMCEFIVGWRKFDEKTKKLGAYLLWNIWMERNKKLFENKTTQNMVIVERVKRQVEEFGKYNASIYAKPKEGKGSIRAGNWQPPPNGVIKINADATVSDNGWVGLGVVARNTKGEVLFAATRRSKARWVPAVAEAKAMVMAVKLGRRVGCEHVTFETDCQEIASRLSKGVSLSTELDLILGDIMSLCAGFRTLTWSHVSREGNFVAHHLARLLPFGDEQVWCNHAPKEVEPYVTMDVLVNE